MKIACHYYYLFKELKYIMCIIFSLNLWSAFASVFASEVNALNYMLETQKILCTWANSLFSHAPPGAYIHYTFEGVRAWLCLISADDIYKVFICFAFAINIPIVAYYFLANNPLSFIAIQIEFEL